MFDKNKFINSDKVIGWIKKNPLLAAAFAATMAITGTGVYMTKSAKNEDVYAVLAADKLPSLQNYPVYYAHEGLPKDRIEDALDCLKNSYEIISRNGEIQDPNIIAQYFPLLVKESFLRQKNDNGTLLKSRTGAMGIAQIKEPAVVDAKKFLQDTLGVDAEDYNPEKMEDNCTLGMVYFIRNKAILKGKLPEKMTFDDEFYYAAYNGGATRIAEMMIMFHKEKKIKHVAWKEFAEWLSAKAIGVSKNKSDIDFSKPYNVEYNNYFQTSLAGNKEVLTFGSDVKTTKEKIQEILNYVEVIDGIRYTDQSARQGEMVTKGRSLLYESHRDEFHGDGWADKMAYNIWKSTGQHSSYRQVMSIPGKGAFSMLSSANIYPSQENLKTFYQLNHLEEDDFIKRDKYYLVPNIETEFFAQKEDEQEVENEVNIPESKLQESPSVATKMTPPNVKKYLESIEVKNNSLKGKIFILDPGHWGIDTGAIRPSVNSNGKNITYTGNDIIFKNGESIKAKNGQGNKLFTIEATLVMDVTLRLATLIRQNGGTVHFTHASTDKITKDIGVSTNKNNPGQLDQLDNDYVKWLPGTKFDVSGWKIQRRMNRQRIRDELLPTNQQNTYLLSIHIDSINNEKDVPLRYLYNTASQQRFAEEMIKNSVEEVGANNSGYLYILRDNQDVDGQELPKNAALVELGNIQNKNFDQRIRTAAGRQAYAESIFNTLKKTATT